jgi:membrane protein required for colicin V production
VTLDLTLLGLVLVFAIWGAFQGAARQIAQTLAGIGAWLVARPAGDFFGSSAAKLLHASLVVGTVFATFASFIAVFVLVRYVLTVVLRRILAGKDANNRTADRLFGFLIGGAKVAMLTWFVVCALSFVEDNITLQGKKIGFVPKDSVTFQLARQYNLFELSQFSGVKDVLAVAKLQADPKRAGKLKDNEDFQRLAKDPRFTALLGSPALKEALSTGDTRSLLGNNGVLELIQDPTQMHRISRIAELQ